MSAISIAAVVVLSVLFAAAMWLIFGHSLLALLSKYIPSFQPPTAVVELIDLAITLVAGVLMIALSYTYLPAGARSFTAQLPGAVCALAGCGALSFGYRVYIDHVSESTMLYGSIATVAFFLVWMYLMFYILIACGFLNRYLQERAAKGETSV